MSRMSDISTGVKTAINANATLTTATIYEREELKQDTTDKTLCVFIRVLDPEPTEAPYVCDIRKYPVEVVIKFVLDERTNEEDTADAVNVLKGTYSDALKTAMRTCHPAASVPVVISNVLQVDWRSEDLSYKETEETTDLSKRDFRIQQIWDFTTYEN